ncbi:MAG: PepSY domain-containing protein [Sphingomicrobium sp.]
MSLYRTLFAAALSVGLIATPALAQRPRDLAPVQPRTQSRDQDRAFEAAQQGRSMPLPNIERRVMPFMGGADYLGPELNGDTYRLKFMRDGRVIWVDVDAATGRILRRSKP